MSSMFAKEVDVKRRGGGGGEAAVGGGGITSRVDDEPMLKE